MKYVSGYYAMPLYVDPNDMSCGLWTETESLYSDINNKLYETEGNPMGDYGIFENQEVPGQIGLYWVANHIRAYLDMLYYEEFEMLEDLYYEAINDPRMMHLIFELVFKYKLYENPKVCEFLAEEFESLFRSYILTVGVEDLVKVINPPKEGKK